MLLQLGLEFTDLRILFLFLHLSHSLQSLLLIVQLVHVTLVLGIRLHPGFVQQNDLLLQMLDRRLWLKLLRTQMRQLTLQSSIHLPEILNDPILSQHLHLYLLDFTIPVLLICLHLLLTSRYYVFLALLEHPILAFHLRQAVA